jgi:hypothetical protein
MGLILSSLAEKMRPEARIRQIALFQAMRPWLAALFGGQALRTRTMPAAGCGPLAATLDKENK